MMKTYRTFIASLLVCLVTTLYGSPAWADDGNSTKNKQLVLIECEAQQCAQRVMTFWRFTSDNGMSFMPYGDRASLDIDKVDNDQIVIRRTNTPTSHLPGLTAVYTGKVSEDNTISGNVTWTYQGKSWSGQWSAWIPSQSAQQQISDRCDLMLAQQNQQNAVQSQAQAGAALLGLMLLIGVASAGGGDNTSADKADDWQTQADHARLHAQWDAEVEAQRQQQEEQEREGPHY